MLVAQQRLVKEWLCWPRRSQPVELDGEKLAQICTWSIRMFEEIIRKLILLSVNRKNKKEPSDL